MTAIITVIIGILLSALGIFGFLAIAISPIIDDWEIVVLRKDDSLFYATKFGKWILKQRTTKMAWECFALLAIGLMLIVSGMYFGFAERGRDFYFYKKIYGEELDRNKLDKLTDRGTYLASDGQEYLNYILIRGKDIYYNGSEEENIVDIQQLEALLEEMPSENTVVLIDSFAISSTYKQVADILNKMGIGCKEEII